MPPGAGEGRTQQVATLRRLGHERFTDDELGGLLDEAAASLAEAPADDLDAALVRVSLRDRARAVLLPSRLITARAEASGRAKDAWRIARETNDFGRFAPHFERILDVCNEEAELLRPLIARERGSDYSPTDADARYDALLDNYEPGGSTSHIASVFAELRAELVPLVAAIAERPAPDDSFLHKPYDVDDQWAFGIEAAEAFGYSLEHGRQDRSSHPFSTSFGITDVRITTRIDPNFFPMGFFGTIHETGHALYEQGIAENLDRTPLADGASLGMHESQSRLWENLVARGAPYWEHAYESLQQRFSDVLRDVSRDSFVRAVNKVQPSLIRVEADELTYHLHVLLRFEIERALVAGTLAVADVPEMWNQRMRDDLGVVPETDADGCLQDIHWSLGAIGYFPTYSLGTLMSSQLWNAAERDLGSLDPQMAAGSFAPLLGWLRENVHRSGRARSTPELLRRATGEDLDAAPWLAYAKAKYGALYGLS